MVLVGGAVGLVLGGVAGRSVETQLYDVRPTDASALVLPLLATVVVAVLAALAPGAPRATD
jgi:hypothetical protein